jgi:predicted CDP-diglyceride synthetase/phosphatidate cytidylyltransferase
MTRVSDMAWALAGAVVLCAMVGLPLASRGGRFRALPGWVGFWVFFAAVLFALPRVPLAVGLSVLGVIMFAALREYFFAAPVRPRDRWAILVCYLTIPVVLVPVYLETYGAFLAGVLLSLLLVQPTALSVGTPRPGLLDALGRVLLGLLVFVFCAAHLGWMAGWGPGRLELFGVLVLASELPQRIAGRLRPAEAVLRPLAGIVLGTAAGCALAAWLGPWLGIAPRHGVVLGLLVAASVTAGRAVTEAVSQDLAMAPASSRVGRGAVLDRTMPAVYAAPLFFHYLQHFA